MALDRIGLLLAKKEGSYGVDPTPAAGTDDILIFDPRPTVDGLPLTRQTLDASLSRRPHVIGRKIFTLDFSTELKGSGTAGTPPEVGVLFEACQMQHTNVPATSDSYAFESSNFDSVTLYFYNDALLHKITGAYGSFELVCPGGEFGRINWHFMGLWNDVTTAAIPGGSVFDTTVPPLLTNAALTVGGFAGNVANFSLNANVRVEESRDLNALTDGLAKLATNGREPGGGFNPLVVPVGTYDVWGLWKAGTEGSLTATFGSAAGNRLKINTAPKLQYTRVGYGVRAGERTFELEYALNRSTAAGDDELVLVYD